MQRADERSDSVDTYSFRANWLEALTLQAKAVEAMLPLNPRKALRLFEQISVPDLPKLTCASTPTPDLVDYYQAAVRMFDQSFTASQRAKEEDVAMLRQVIVSVQAPAQVPPAMEMLSAVKLTTRQRRDLLSLLASELQEISRSDRQYGAAEARLVSALPLVHLESSEAAVFLPGLRSYIAMHVSGRRCAEYLPVAGKMAKSAEQFNLLVDKLDPTESRYRRFSAEQAKPAGDDGSYPRNLFGQSSQSQAVTDALRWLMHGDRVRNGRVVRWTAEQRSSRDWLAHYDDAAKLVHELNESDEKSREAFFCMKADALNILATLVPPGHARDKAMDEYREFLEQYYSSIENPKLWFTMFRHMLYTARFSDEPKAKTWILAELSKSSNPIIALYAKFETRIGPPKVTKGFSRAMGDCCSSCGVLGSMGVSSTGQSGSSRWVRALALIRLENADLWLKFLLALIGLGLAFAAALFSTISRESGNVWATLILASAALMLATLVGLTTVPHLARRVVIKRLRDAVDYEVTRAGIIYVIATLLIGIAALNTGNNLLYIVVAAMLAAILVSGIVSAVGLRDLALDVRLPEHVFAGRPVLGRILLDNPRRRLPSFSIHVVPSKRKKPVSQWLWEPATFGFPPKRPPEQQWVRLPDRRVRRIVHDGSTPGIFDGSAYFPYLAPATELSADLELRFQRRGRYSEDSFGLATRFPFAFLTKTRRVPLNRTVLVYPSVEPTDEFLDVLPMITGEVEAFVRGRGYDLYRIREYMPEDTARHVDWKATAKSGSLKVREFSREDERKVRLVFDNPSPGVLAPAAYERAVALAASLAWHFASADADLSFAVQGYGGEPDVYKFLAYLALLEPQPTGSIIDTLPVSGDYNIVLTGRARGSIPTALWNCSYLLFLTDSPAPIRARETGVPEKLLRARS